MLYQLQVNISTAYYAVLEWRAEYHRLGYAQLDMGKAGERGESRFTINQVQHLCTGV
jgi:hypothetical protein